MNNFRGIKKAYIVTVLEGSGETREDYCREVIYVYNEEMVEIGKFDNSK